MSISTVARGASRRMLTAALLAAFLSLSIMPVMASTVGVLSGTITTTTNKLIDHASITVVSPSGSYKATTNAHGFFSITGVQQDTYTVSVTAPGYEATSVTGVTVSADQTTPFNVALSPTIVGYVAARSTVLNGSLDRARRASRLRAG